MTDDDINPSNLGGKIFFTEPDMCLITLSNTKVYVKFSELARVPFQNQRFHVYFLLIIFTLILFDPYDRSSTWPPGTHWMFWIAIPTAFFLVFFAVLKPVHVVFNRPIYVSAVCLTTTIIVAVIMLNFEAYMLGIEMISFYEILKRTPFNYGMVLLFELTYFHLVFQDASDLENQEPEGEQAQTSPKPTRKNTLIRIDKLGISVASIILVKSDGHYVNVQTSTQKFYARARISDVAARIGESYGVLVSRSLWVSSEIIQHYVEKNGKLILLLKDGSQVDVARPRKKDVIAWLNGRFGAEDQ